MQKAKQMNSSKKRNMNDFMSQGVLEVEKVVNDSQHFHSIQGDPIA